MGLGVLIGLSSWLAGMTSSSTINWNAVIIAAVVLGLATVEAVQLQRWEEVLEIASGLWLITSPFLFGCSAMSLIYWHFVLGAAVALLAALAILTSHEGQRSSPIPRLLSRAENTLRAGPFSDEQLSAHSASAVCVDLVAPVGGPGFNDSGGCFNEDV